MRRTRIGRKSVALGAIVVLSGALAGGAGAQQGTALAPQAERTIRVSGTGDVQVRPDIAEISFAVETQASSAREAGLQNAVRMDRVIAALVAAGVPRTDIETRNYSVYPEYVHEEGVREPKISGYRATNQMALETRKLDRVGELIDVALGAGANRMDGVSFRVSNPEAAQAEALREAVTHARASAEAMASALGVQLGPILDASTNTDPIRPMAAVRFRDAKMEMAAAAPPTPIEPGEQTITAFVQLVFAIGGAR